VYVSFVGNAIMLAPRSGADDTDGTDVIYLVPSVFDSLVKFKERVYAEHGDYAQDESK
jgi:hypothetical protein